MQSPGKIEDLKKKIHARARKMLYHRIGNFVWANVSGGGKVGGSLRNSAAKNRRMSEIPRGTWFSGAQRGGPWLCSAGPLAEK